MSLQSPSPSARKQLAKEKAKKPPYNVMPEQNPFAELLSTEADFLDDMEAAITGLQIARSKTKSEGETAALTEIENVLTQFLQRQEQAFQLMMNERSPQEWANAIYKMQDAYMQLLLLLEKAKFSDVANDSFKKSVKEAGRVSQDIHSYLSKPMQRLQRYHLLIGEIIKITAPSSISSHSDFAQRSLTTLHSEYVQAQYRLKAIVEKSNLFYGIVSSAQQFKENTKKQDIAAIERIVNDCLRKKETGDYALPPELVIINLKGYLKDESFVKALKQVITQKRSELEKKLSPTDESMQVLQYLSKEAFREQTPLREERQVLQNQEKFLLQQLAFHYGQANAPVPSAAKQAKKQIEQKETELVKLRNKIGELSQKITSLEEKQAGYEERHQKMQQEKKEASREQNIPVRMDYHQLNLLQKELEQGVESVLMQNTTPPKPPRPPRQPK